MSCFIHKHFVRSEKKIIAYSNYLSRDKKEIYNKFKNQIFTWICFSMFRVATEMWEGEDIRGSSRRAFF